MNCKPHLLKTEDFFFLCVCVNICVDKCTAEQEHFGDYLIPRFLNDLLQDNPRLVVWRT